MSQTPLVSVIIPTYNRSASLRYAIKTVLWQTVQDFELLVIGDACTDDSEEVVRAFGDDRIHWHNLPENSGSQGVPNQKGNELAQGTYIAYLGHDDLWFPNHLETLVTAMETGDADVVYPLILVVYPDGGRILFGLSPNGEYQPYQFVSPTGIMHCHKTVQDIGGWLDYKKLDRPTDVDILVRLYQGEKKFQYIEELTVVKFSAGLRPNSYVDDDGAEQRDYYQKIQNEPDLRYRELMRVLQSAVSDPDKQLFRRWQPRQLEIARTSEASRIRRGLQPKMNLNVTLVDRPPIYEYMIGLEVLNREQDITPLRCRKALYNGGQIPRNGLLFGSWWEHPVYSRWGDTWRNPSRGAEIVVTNPRQPERSLMIELQAAKKRVLIFEIKNMADQTIAKIRFSERSLYVVPLQFTVGQGTVYRVYVYPPAKPEEDAGKDCLVYRLDWYQPTAVQTGEMGQSSTTYKILRHEYSWINPDVDEY